MKHTDNMHTATPTSNAGIAGQNIVRRCIVIRAAMDTIY